ncbi:hypothetical protein MIMGU_mgv1a019862mg [Erythranthe guttata]|uniref:Uncharacterized protein n=1 Tax=Erythranthe guttata TaxID=4155 RepID=A0A022RPV9_ERYGU|nr:hypothetical protein MIMGU_mgv1a019862mg [Erythranthe guttata]
MSAMSSNDYEENDEDVFLDESDIINEYDVDAEELPDANEEGGSDGEDDSDEVDDSIHIFTGHTGEVYAAACSPTDAALVATGGGDDKGFIWKINNGDSPFELHGHEDSVSSLSFSPNGNFLASGSLDGTVKVWDIANGELKCTLEYPNGGIAWVRWHPNGGFVLAGSEDNSSVCMWNPDMASYMHVFSGHASSVTCGDFTPDGRRICTGSDDATLRIWDLETSKVLGSSSECKHSGSVEFAAFQPSSRSTSWRAATGGLDKKLIIWDQDLSPRWTCHHTEGVTCLVWLSRHIATGCVDGKIRIWNILSGVCEKTLSGHCGAIQSIKRTCDGDFLVSVSVDGTARVFEIAQFK